MKLRTKLFLKLTLFAIIPQMILTTMLIFNHAESSVQRTTDILDHRFDSFIERVEYGYDAIQHSLNVLIFYSNDGHSVISTLERIVEAEESLPDFDIHTYTWTINSICQSVSYSYDYLEGIYIMLPSGTLISHTTNTPDRTPANFDPTTEQWYQQTLEMNGRLFYSSANTKTVLPIDPDSIIVSQSLLNIYTHEDLGVVLLACDPSIFSLDADDTLDGLTCFTLRNPATGEIIWSNEDSAGFDVHSPAVRSLTASVTDSDLELTLMYDYGSLIHDTYRSIAMVVLFSAVCELFILFLVWGITGKLTRPLEKLSNHVMHQQEMQVQPFAEYADRHDEIGMLIRVYNEMAENLNAAIREKYEYNLMILDTQMRALEANINSHFLFNTLEAINSMAELDDNEPIATMSLSLGRMFRYAIKTEREQVSLREEIRHAMDYVSIQRIRFDDRFSLLLDVPEELMEKQVLKLMLQPLVENALQHGLNFCTSGNEIRIRARLEGAGLSIEVADNGQGIQPERLKQIEEMLASEAAFTQLGHRTKQSIGLKNIQSRIELYYGKGFGLALKSTVGEGTTIHLTVPLLSK